MSQREPSPRVRTFAQAHALLARCQERDWLTYEVVVLLRCLGILKPIRPPARPRD